MAYAHISNLWDSVKNLVLTQYRTEDGEPEKKIVGLVKLFVKNLQTLEDSSDRLADWADFTQAEGAWVDVVGNLVGLKRNAGESDESFKERIALLFGYKKAGTVQHVINTAINFSGDPSPTYFEEQPGVFFVYTPNGSQIKRVVVQNTAPAGVLGVPGAAIRLADGSLLGTTDEKILLTVADDENIGSDIYLYLGDDQLTLDGVELMLN